MPTLIGTIEKFEAQPSHHKTELTLKQPNNKLAFVDFRGDHQLWLKKVKAGDVVEVSFEVYGRLSKATGTKFNNIIANHLSKL